MRLQVQIRGECLAIPCPSKDNVEKLGDMAIVRLKKLKPALFAGGDLEIAEIRKTLGGAILDPDDKIGDVLRDGEFVTIVMKKDYRLWNGEAIGYSNGMKDVHSNVVHSPEDSLFISYDYPEQFIPPSDVLTLTGNDLTTEDLVRCGRGLYRIRLSIASENKINEARQLLEHIVEEKKVVYGITTGFGNFSHVYIAPKNLKQLQLNLIRSHACGVGPPLPPSRVRMVLALRINVLAKGYSGISLDAVQKMVDAFNAFCVSWVPEKGTVGCSGDLAPLAHLALGLMGEGRMWSPETGWAEAMHVLKMHNLQPICPGPKEGIALINGTQLVSALGAEAVERAQAIARQADVVAALTLDVLKGTTKAFDYDIHALRPHPGQVRTAERLRALLHSDVNPSQIAESHRFCKRVQDAYTLRCVPQVHGVVHDTITFVQGILNTELNSATDNPLVFAERGEILSAGNFHGEYPAKVLDYLAIGVHELAQMSERRLERLVNGALSGLPSFLVKEGGLNSGFMMIQTTAAALVSENKVLCHPSSVDSIPTSGNQEDHVSMGGFSARKALMVVEHVEQVLAMELLAACQGMDFLKPLLTTTPLQEVYKLVRNVSAPIHQDRYMAPEIDKIVRLLQNQQVWGCVQPHLSRTRESEKVDPLYLTTPRGSPTSSSVTGDHTDNTDKQDGKSSAKKRKMQ